VLFTASAEKMGRQFVSRWYTTAFGLGVLGLVTVANLWLLSQPGTYAS
jgi:hypothetical protein